MIDKLRKAAILISALDQRSADALLEQMPPEQAARIRAVLVDLEDVDQDEQRAVLREFMQKQRPARNGLLADDDGVELSPELQQKLAQPAELREAVTASPPRPFHFLQSAPADELARLLQAEHPQVTAVVLSHVPPHTAAQVLELFPEELQLVVLRRAADLDRADPEILRELENQLHLAWRQVGDTSSARAGINTVQAILRAADASQRDRLINRLQQTDQRLAARLHGIASPAAKAASSTPAVNHHDESSLLSRPSLPPGISDNRPLDVTRSEPDSSAQHYQYAESLDDLEVMDRDDSDLDTSLLAPLPPASREPLSFEDVWKLSHRDLAAVLQAADPQLTLLALAGAPDEYVQTVLRQLPARDARRLRHRLRNLGPLLLRDVERAQGELAELATLLMHQGLVTPPPSRGFAVAV